VKLDYSAAFSAMVRDTAYIVRIASPIAEQEWFQKRNLKQLRPLIQRLNQDYPLVRTVMNENAQRSHFYVSSVVEFPLFATSGKLELLSKSDFDAGIKQLVEFADSLERSLSSGHADLRLDDVQPGSSLNHGQDTLLARVGKELSIEKFDWRTQSTITGDVAVLMARLSVQLPVNLNRQKNLSTESLCLEAMRLNSEYPLVNFLADDDQSLRLQVCFPSENFDDDERKILQRWFSAVLSKFHPI
jgi:hypothetical protein